MSIKSKDNNEPDKAVAESRSGVVDPTANVRALNEASVKRADDMQELYQRLAEERYKRSEDITNIKTSHLHELITIAASHQKAMSALESKRLDAIRLVDQTAVTTEAARSAGAITALAIAATTKDETLRSAVNTSAMNLATQLDRTVTAITERIAALEKSSYTGAGKQAVADPQLERMNTMMEQIMRNQANVVGKSEGIVLSWGVLVGAIGILSALFAAAFALFKAH